MTRVSLFAVLIVPALSHSPACAQVSDPWTTPATAEQESTFVTRFPPASVIAVPEAREHPLRLFDALPAAWVGRSADSLFAFDAEVSPGEFFVFQIGVYAAARRLDNVRIVTEGLGGPGGEEPTRGGASTYRISW